MPTTINLQGRLGEIQVPPGWQKPCKAGQWRDGVLAASTSVGLGSSYFPFDDVPAGLAPDGNGGIFVLTTCNWEPGQGPFALRPISAIGKSALRVEFGNPTFWAANRGLWSEGTLVPSGSGRCIVVWAKDFDHFTIMAQCYDQNGQPLWNNGNPINASGGFNWAWRMPLNLLAEPDGNDGVIIAWLETAYLALPPPPSVLIHFQRIDANGNASLGLGPWPGGTLDLSQIAYGPPLPWVQLVPDGSGGAFMITCEAGNNCVVYTIQANGSFSGVAALISMSANGWMGGQRIRRAVTDGQGGFFFSYIDASGQLRVLRYTSANGVLWDVGFSTLLIHPTAFHVREDDRGGLLIAFISSPWPRLNLQRMDGNGRITWSINPAISLTIPSGSAFWSADQWSRLAQAVPDGNGGAVLVYQDFPNGRTPKLFSICFDSSGQPVSPAQEVSARATSQELPMVAAVGRSSALVAWADDGAAAVTGLDVYAQRIGCCPPSTPSSGLEPWPRFGCEIIQLPGLGNKEMLLNLPCGNRERQLGVIPLTRLFANVRGLDHPGSIFNRDVAAPDWLRIRFSGLPPGTEVRLYSMKGRLLAEGKPLKGIKKRTAELAQCLLTFKPPQKEDQLLVFSNTNKLEPDATVSIRLSSEWGNGKVPPMTSKQLPRTSKLHRKSASTTSRRTLRAKQKSRHALKRDGFAK